MAAPDPDPFDLQRFVAAQDPVWDRVLEELAAGAKRSHWMWFVFPQRTGLGHSAMAQRYGIRSMAEARAYLGHPVLGPRLAQCLRLLLALPPELGAQQVFGAVDALKLHACASLFAAAQPQQEGWRQLLGRFYGGVPQPQALPPA